MAKRKLEMIDEVTKEVVISRIFGKNCASKIGDDKQSYCGYVGGEVTEVVFLGTCIVIKRKEQFALTYKWSDTICNALMQTDGVKYRKEGWVSFNEQKDAYFDLDTRSILIRFQTTETDSSMNKQLFYFDFPQSGETITKEMNPLAVKDAAVKYLKTQNEVRGDICIIKDSRENVIAMGYVSDSMKVSFFTEDETVNDIKPIGVIEEGGER